MKMIAMSFMQWFFLGVLVALTAVSGIIALAVVTNLARNPRR